MGSINLTYPIPNYLFGTIPHSRCKRHQDDIQFFCRESQAKALFATGESWVRVDPSLLYQLSWAKKTSSGVTEVVSHFQPQYWAPSSGALGRTVFGMGFSTKKLLLLLLL